MNDVRHENSRIDFWRMTPEIQHLYVTRTRGDGRPDTVLSTSRGAPSACCGNWIARRDHLRRQLSLRKMLLVQCSNKRGMALLSTRAEGIVVWVWRNVDFSSNGHELCLFPQQVDDLAYQDSPNTESAENAFVFRNDFFRHQPGKRPLL